MGDEVLFEVKGSVATITLNRPERKNAINQALLTGLYNSVENIAESDEIKVGIITGSGNAFCSGIDLSCLCEKISAERALNCGLVNEIIPADKLLIRATKIAEEICKVNYDMMLTMKKLIEAKNGTTLNEAMRMEQKGFKSFLEDFAK